MVFTSLKLQLTAHIRADSPFKYRPGVMPQCLVIDGSTKPRLVHHLYLIVIFQDSFERRFPLFARAAGVDEEQEEGKLGRVRARGGAVHQEHHRQVRRVRVRAHQDQLRSEERGRADQDYLSKGKMMFEISSITKRTLLYMSFKEACKAKCK